MKPVSFDHHHEYDHETAVADARLELIEELGRVVVRIHKTTRGAKRPPSPGYGTVWQQVTA